MLGNRRFQRYMLSGFVRCAICGGHYIITTRYSYRCGTFRNRGEVGCANHLAVSRRRLERVVVEALRDRLYTPENHRAVVERVRELLRGRGRRHAARTRQADRERELDRIEREIENVKQAVRLGKATSTLMGMLEEVERRRAELLAEESPADGVPARLARVLERLPELARQQLADLETLLAANQVDKGKAILAAFDTTIRLYPCRDHLEAEITGTVERLVALAAATGRGGSTEPLFGGGGGGI